MNKRLPLSKVRYIGFGIATVFVLAWCYSAALDFAFINYPRKPVLTEGRTVAYLVKQRVVYITTDQRQLLSVLDYIEAGAAVLLGVIFLSYGKAAFRNPFGPEADEP